MNVWCLDRRKKEKFPPSVLEDCVFFFVMGVQGNWLSGVYSRYQGDWRIYIPAMLRWVCFDE